MKYSDLEEADRPETVDLFVSVSRTRLYDDESAVLVLDAEAWEGEPIAGGGKTQRRLIGFYCDGLQVAGEHTTEIVQEIDDNTHPLGQSVFVRVKAARVNVQVRATPDEMVSFDDVEWEDMNRLLDEC